MLSVVCNRHAVHIDNMLSMSADAWAFSVALCLTFVPLNGVENCNNQSLPVSLGSSVLLQCHFAKANHQWVTWLQMPAARLVNLTSKGLIWYDDPRQGRVKTFPNHASKGNYSMRIDELQQSDLGRYRCEQAGDCFQVELVAKKDEKSDEIKLLVYICVGGAVVICLVGVCCYCCVKCATKNSLNNPDSEGISPPPVVPGGDAGGANDHDLVYENDAHDPANHQAGGPSYPQSNEHTANASQADPNRNHSNFDRMQNRSQKVKQRFHTELLSRLRHASCSRHYYVNQSELHQHATTSEVDNHQRGRVARKKAKQKCEYNNPIYNKSPGEA
ncbi:uncharacterized protein LOC142991760 isoform X1 [Genypterus blacodes]|uniref:uncharacterized protein LOC142991760 isoform X1 n=1 Tax=Genypterus blacodes TaxID=154954 RepID=UPI003F75A596